MAKPEPKKPEVPCWQVKLAEVTDEAFVYDSWIKSAHRTYPNMHAVDFCADERARIQRIIFGGMVAVAHVAVDRNELLGHLVYGQWRSTLVVHYAFVKPDARRHGVFRSMLAFANHQKFPVVLTAPAVDSEVMTGLVKRYLYDQRILPLMQRGGA